MDIYSFFEQLFIALDRQDNHVIITAVYLGLAVLAVVLRVVTHLHFRGAVMTFQLEARKEIKSRDEIPKLKNGLLRRVVSEYIRVADRAVTSIPTHHLVDRAISNMGLLGWRYDSLLPFVESLEAGLLWIGLILAVVFSDFAFVYGTLAVVIFIVVRIVMAFFNARGARRQLSDELIIYVEREIGRFFASDSGGAVLRLKNDLTEVINQQTAAYKTTMDSVSSVMTATLSEVAKSMTAAAETIPSAVANALDEKLIDMNATLSATLENWKDALGESAAIQTSINTSADRLSHAAAKLQSASELLSTHMQGHSNALSEQLITLVTAIDAVKSTIDNLTAQQDALTKQAQYIERNQHTLEASLHAYEDSLQSLTKSLGDGLGAFINLHAQTSAQTINDTLKANIDKIMQLLIKGGDTT